MYSLLWAFFLCDNRRIYNKHLLWPNMYTTMSRMPDAPQESGDLGVVGKMGLYTLPSVGRQ